MVRNVIQSFKKVINSPGTSRAAATVIQHFISTGTDSVAAGQTGPTDDAVPTGSIIKAFYINYCATNLVAVSHFHHVSVQLTRSGQSVVDPTVVGGNPQRNQVFFQKLYSIGKEQNSTIAFWFKVPKKYQRVREGDKWSFVVNGDTVYSDAYQCIYKFYR